MYRMIEQTRVDSRQIKLNEEQKRSDVISVDLQKHRKQLNSRFVELQVHLNQLENRYVEQKTEQRELDVRCNEYDAEHKQLQDKFTELIPKSKYPIKRKRLSLIGLYGKEDGVFKCNECVYTCGKQHTMSQHVKFHHTTPTESCSHEGCNKIFHTCQQLRQHIKNKHTTEKPFKCHYCDFYSKQKGNIKQHMNRCKYNPKNL